MKTPTVWNILGCTLIAAGEIGTTDLARDGLGRRIWGEYDLSSPASEP